MIIATYYNRGSLVSKSKTDDDAKLLFLFSKAFEF